MLLWPRQQIGAVIRSFRNLWGGFLDISLAGCLIQTTTSRISVSANSFMLQLKQYILFCRGQLSFSLLHINRRHMGSNDRLLTSRMTHSPTWATHSVGSYVLFEILRLSFILNPGIFPAVHSQFTHFTAYKAAVGFFLKTTSKLVFALCCSA